MIAGPLKRYYCRVLKVAAEKQAKRLGVKFRYVELDGICWTKEELFALRRSCLAEILSGDRPDSILLDGYRDVDMVTRALTELGATPGGDIQVVNDFEAVPGTVLLRADYLEFAKAAKSLIDGVVAHPAKPFGRVVLSGLIRRSPVEIGEVKTASSP
jgi:hypothetical protein